MGARGGAEGEAGFLLNREPDVGPGFQDPRSTTQAEGTHLTSEPPRCPLKGAKREKNLRMFLMPYPSHLTLLVSLTTNGGMKKGK